MFRVHSCPYGILLSMLSVALFLHLIPNNAGHHIERKYFRTVVMTEEITMDSPGILMSEWGVGLGSFPSDDSQELISLEISAPGERFTVFDIKDKYNQSFKGMRVQATEQNQNKLTVRDKVTIKLFSLTLADGAPKDTPTLANRSRFLTNYNKAESDIVQRWLAVHNLSRKSGMSDIELAQSILDKMKEVFRYKFIASGERGITGLCRNGFGACGELNDFIVTALKVFNIPARIRPGRNIIGDQRPLQLAEDNTMHVAAEFWADGVGWVPIEASAMDGKSLEEGGKLVPFLGKSTGDFIGKHYDYVYLDSQVRSFQIGEFVFGQWRGNWDGWKLTNKLGFITTDKAQK